MRVGARSYCQHWVGELTACPVRAPRLSASCCFQVKGCVAHCSRLRRSLAPTLLHCPLGGNPSLRGQLAFPVPSDSLRNECTAAPLADCVMSEGQNRVFPLEALMTGALSTTLDTFSLPGFLVLLGLPLVGVWRCALACVPVGSGYCGCFASSSCLHSTIYFPIPLPLSSWRTCVWHCGVFCFAAGCIRYVIVPLLRSAGSTAFFLGILRLSVRRSLVSARAGLVAERTLQ